MTCRTYYVRVTLGSQRTTPHEQTMAEKNRRIHDEIAMRWSGAGPPKKPPKLYRQSFGSASSSSCLPVTAEYVKLKEGA